MSRIPLFADVYDENCRACQRLATFLEESSVAKVASIGRRPIIGSVCHGQLLDA